MGFGVINLDLIELGTSTIHGIGGFAKRNIPAGTLMGPYRGKHMNTEERAKVKDGSYIWKINDEWYIDAKNYPKNNPLRYINGAKTRSQKKRINLVMMNIGKTPKTEKIYYMATKNIPKGEELIISYGNNYF